MELLPGNRSSQLARIDRTALLRDYARTRKPIFQEGKPTKVPEGASLHNCECCQDTGVVEPWKLKRFMPEIFGDVDIDPLMSLPVFCDRLPTCGDREQAVWVDPKNQDEDKNDTRLRNLNLYSAGDGSSSYVIQLMHEGKLLKLDKDESDRIHAGVLEYRAQLFTPEGRAYIDEIAKRAKEALPDPNIFKGTNTGQRKFHPIGALCVPFEMPPEPWADPQPTQPHYDDF